MFRQRHETEGLQMVVAVEQVVAPACKLLREVFGWDL